MNKRVFITIIASLVLVSAGVFVGCAVSTNPTTTAPSGSSLTGVAATGAPIINATVTVKDKNGIVKTTTTDANGKYTVDVSGLTAPYLVKVALADGSKMYSIGMSPGTVNAHPLTHAILVLWCQAQGSTVNPGVFFNTPSAYNPTAQEINAIEAVLHELVGPQIESTGLADQFHLINSAFTANGLGFDNVLERIKVYYAGGLAYIDQRDPIDGSSTGTLLALPLGMNLALSNSPFINFKASINNGLSAFMNTVNTVGCSLTGADIQQYLTPTYVWKGYDANAFAQGISSYLLGCGTANPRTISSMSVKKVRSFQPINQKAVIIANIVMSDGVEMNVRFVFKKIGGSWLLDGNGEVAEINLRSDVTRLVTSTGTTVTNSLVFEMFDHMNLDLPTVVINGPLGASYTANVVCANSAAPSCGGNYGVYKYVVPNFLPHLGAFYRIYITNSSGAGLQNIYKRFILTTPGKSGINADFPTFTGFTTHSLSSVTNTTLSGNVYIPKWVTDVDPPTIEYYNGGNKLGQEDVSWSYGIMPPMREMMSPFTAFINSTFGGQAVTKVLLKGHANADNLNGWGRTTVIWEFQ